MDTSTTPVEVSLRVMFLKLGEIDTVKECFTTDALIESKWREHSLDGRTDLNLTEIPVDKYWNPKLYVDNTVGEPKETISQTLHLNSRQEAFLINQKRIKGVFLENLELQEFPFDTQDLTLTVISEHTVKEITLNVDADNPSSINVVSFVDEQEWQLYHNVEVTKSSVNRVHGGSGGIQHPCLAFKCHASRRYGYFLWNIFFVMLFICGMAFTTFSVNYNLPQNRIQLMFILLLTTVAFRTNVNNSLPKISYLTYMDKYMLVGWGIQCFICIWHAIVGTALPANKNTYWADIIVLIIFATIYTVLQIAFLLFIYTKVKNQGSRSMEKKSPQKKSNTTAKQSDVTTASTTSLIPSRDSKTKYESTPLRGDGQKSSTTHSYSSTNIALE